MSKPDDRPTVKLRLWAVAFLLGGRVKLALTEGEHGTLGGIFRARRHARPLARQFRDELRKTERRPQVRIVAVDVQVTVADPSELPTETLKAAYRVVPDLP